MSINELKIRCSSIGKIMTNPTAAAMKAGEILSVGAKTYLRELAQQELFNIVYEVSSKEMEKGIMVEDESIAMLGRVRGLALVKNTEHRSNEYITGTCDIYLPELRRGFDTKSSWSAKTFPGWAVDCHDSVYEWQMRGYMWLWDAKEWEVNWCLVDTPEKLIGYEPAMMHAFSGIPEHHRVSSWLIKRDFEKEREMIARIKVAREYMAAAMREFDEFHPQLSPAA